MELDRMQDAPGCGEALHRDNSRFKFLHTNDKPQLPEDCEGTLSTTPILMSIRERQAIAD